MKTRRENVFDNYHGTMIADPYRWLENQDDLEVKVWVEGQNRMTEEFFKTARHRIEIKERLTELWNYPRVSLPVKVDSWIFYQKNDGLQNQSILYRQEGLDGEVQVVLDPNIWSTDGTAALSNFSVDNSGRYMAYSVSVKGSDRQEIRIRDLETMEDLEEALQWCKFTNMAWLGSDGFYYSRYPKPGTVVQEDENNYHQVFWHKIGTPQSEDILIYSRPDAKELSFSPGVTADERYLILHVFHGTDSRNGFYYKDLNSREEFVRLLEEGCAKYVFLGNDETKFYFLTDSDAPKGRIMAVDIKTPQKEHWEEVIPEQSDVMSGVRFINDQFVISFMHHAHSLLRIYSKTGECLRDVSLPALGSIEGFSGKQQDTEMFLSFTSFLYPSVSFHYDLNTHTLKPFNTYELHFKPDDFEVTQVFYSSKDGTKVPMFIVHKKDLKLDGNNPTLLYGYGGFNIPMTPAFSPSRILWLEKGGVFALSNIRGGSEYGEEWHRGGMLEKKQNVFDDFMAAGEWLVKHKYTNSRRLAVEGRSNGGLLVSACLVQRPDLFGAVVCVYLSLICCAFINSLWAAIGYRNTVTQKKTPAILSSCTNTHLFIT